MINSDLIASVQKRLDDPSGRSFTGNLVARELGLAAGEISAHRTFQKYLFAEKDTSIALSEGTTEYDLPTDYNFQVNRVIYNPGSAERRRLYWMPIEQIGDYYDSLVNYYSVRGDKLIIAGTPVSADDGIGLEVLYSEKDGEYLNDGNETVLGARFPHLLVNKVAWELSMSEQDSEIASSADRFERSYLRGFDQAVQMLSQQGTSESKYVKTSTEDMPI